jgi:hypothetical protein
MELLLNIVANPPTGEHAAIPEERLQQWHRRSDVL